MKNSKSSIDFSAQFGGNDAAAAVLDHFKALKFAAKGLAIEGFPFPELTFILRVDGEVNQYGFSGLANIDVDRDGEYLSVDIGITERDRDDLENRIINALLASPETIASASARHRIPEFDADVLVSPLDLLSERYSESLPSRSS